MTTVIAIEDGDGIHVCCDGRLTSEDGSILSDSSKKVYESNRFFIAESGFYVEEPPIKVIEEFGNKKRFNAFDIRDSLLDHITAYDKSEDTRDNLADSSWLFGCADGLFLICGDGSVLKFPVGVITSIGSGGDYARAAYLALHNRTMLKETAMKRSVNVAKKMDSGTGGDVVYKRFLYR